MTVHYSVESLLTLFLSDEYISDKNIYQRTHSNKLKEVSNFLNSIEKSCQLIEVSKTSLRSQLFNWPDNYNSWQKESNFNLYKVNKCREKLIQKIFK